MHLYFKMLFFCLFWKDIFLILKLNLSAVLVVNNTPTISMLGNAYVHVNKKQIKKQKHECYIFFKFISSV